MEVITEIAAVGKKDKLTTLVRRIIPFTRGWVISSPISSPVRGLKLADSYTNLQGTRLPNICYLRIPSSRISFCLRRTLTLVSALDAFAIRIYSGTETSVSISIMRIFFAIFLDDKFVCYAASNGVYDSMRIYLSENLTCAHFFFIYVPRNTGKIYRIARFL